MTQPESTIIYEVRVRRTDKGRVVASLLRGGDEKDLAHLTANDTLRFLSKKPRYFFDGEDEELVLQRCRELGEEPFARVGSIELCLFLHPGPSVEVQFVGGAVLGWWTPSKGMRFETDAHPVFKKDKDAIALHCWQLPQGTGGVFVSTDYPPAPGGILHARK